ncbi:MAG: PAS domain S-box protein [Dehalococcoidia bacterium]|nr:PAS domain S-box protein [Dehalococcoidia bacterium]MDW8119400.1 PAS domain S-box protein [Chloroflexota bacterium]
MDDRAWLGQQILDQSMDAIIVADREGRIRFWNRGAEATFGWTAQEAVGHSLDLIIPERHRPRHWEGYRRVMETGVTKYGHTVLAVPALRKDGSRISLEFTIVLLKGGDGQVVGIGALMRDVTARWERERALLERLQALEAQVRNRPSAPDIAH